MQIYVKKPVNGIKSIGKDRIIALFNNKKLQEIDKILANNQIDKNINF